MKAKDKDKKVRFSAAIRVFEGFATLLFVFLFMFATLSVCTSRLALKEICGKYVKSATLNEEYFANYIDSGFTLEATREILTDDRMYDMVSSVMVERMTALFRYSNDYKLTREECESKIREIIVDYSYKYQVDLAESKIISLTAYTMDISGINSMFIYDTPLAYRTVVSSAKELEELNTDTELLKGIAFLSKWYFITIIAIMYIIVLIIIAVICNKEELTKIPAIIANTSLNPAILLLGISLGGLLCLPTESLVVKFVFKYMVINSIIGIIWGVVSFFILKKITEKIDDDRFSEKEYEKLMKSKEE